MEIETLFTEQKWNILRCLSDGPHSPMQLAEKLKTTMANISQQLRLLEVAKLVKKEKISNRDRGKPRTLYSLLEEYGYLISVMSGFAEKKLLGLTEHHKFILKVWFLENNEVGYCLEQFYWAIIPYLNKVHLIAFNPEPKEIEVIILCDRPAEIERKLGKIVVRSQVGETKQIKIKAFGLEEAKKLIKQAKHPFSSVKELEILYDPRKVLLNLKKSVEGDRQS
jgi:DNA-binding HxlR family transcriptional regulator